MANKSRDSKTIIHANTVFNDFKVEGGKFVNIGGNIQINTEDIAKLIGVLQPAIDQSNLPGKEKKQIQQQIEVIEQEVNNPKPNGAKILEILGPLLDTVGKIATVAKALNESGVLRNILPGLPGS
jgi:hypothetical protein